MKAIVKKRKKADRIARLEAEVAALKTKLAEAIAQIPNVNIHPLERLRRLVAECPHNIRYC